jgi:hypothetical protein
MLLAGKSVVDRRRKSPIRGEQVEYPHAGAFAQPTHIEEEYHEIYPCNFRFCQELLLFYETQDWRLLSDGRWHYTRPVFCFQHAISDILDAQTKQRVSIRDATGKCLNMKTIISSPVSE